MQARFFSEAHLEYGRNGYVIFRDVLDDHLVAEAREHFEWLRRRNPGRRPEDLNTDLVVGDPFWVRLAGDERLLDIAETFLGPDIALFASHYICKPPGSGLPVLWHQDGSYWPLDPMEVITLWVALTDVTPANGCMKVIPGTHEMRLADVVDRPDQASVLGSGMDETLVQGWKSVDIILKPGDVEIHHPNIVHGSLANKSDQWRMGLTLRYIPASTRIIGKAGSPYLLRGNPHPGINEYLPRPRFDPDNHMAFNGCEEWK